MTTTETSGAKIWAENEELPGLRRRMTRERMRWYADALLGTSEPGPSAMIAEANVHTDDEFARGQGLSGIISDGMISTNWISSVLIAAFGRSYLERGSLRTKFIRPIFEDQVITARAVIRSVVASEFGFELELEVWCENETGQKCTVGTASVTGTY